MNAVESATHLESKGYQYYDAVKSATQNNRTLKEGQEVQKL